MRARIARSIGLLSALGSAATSIAVSAEWSAAPVVGWTVDHNSNRSLSRDAQASQRGSMAFDLLLSRADPTFQLALQPHVDVHRYTNDGASDYDDRSLNLSARWAREHSQWNFSAGVSQESTLTSELTDTGLAEGDTARRTRSAGGGWRLQHAEHRSLDIQLSYADVDYQGLRADRLPGYEYTSVSIGERFAVSSLTAFSVSAFGSDLQSGFSGGDSRDAGLSIAAERALSDRTLVHASVGYSARHIAGESDQGYIGEVELTHDAELATWRLYFERRLTASGLGFLVERDEAGVVFNRPLSPMWSANLRIQAVRNDSVAFAANGERVRYETAEAGLDWRNSATSVMSLRVASSRAQQNRFTDLEEGWRAAVSLTWSPRPKVLS